MALGAQVPTIRKDQSNIDLTLPLNLRMLGLSLFFFFLYSSLVFLFLGKRGISLMETSAWGMVHEGRLLHNARSRSFPPPSATLVVAPAWEDTQSWASLDQLWLSNL